MATERHTRQPPRGPLAPEVEKAVRTIHYEVWASSYKPGEGPMHYAGGRYWHDRLLRHADNWEKLAAAARIAATALPEDDA